MRGLRKFQQKFPTCSVPNMKFADRATGLKVRGLRTTHWYFKRAIFLHLWNLQEDKQAKCEMVKSHLQKFQTVLPYMKIAGRATGLNVRWLRITHWNFKHAVFPLNNRLWISVSTHASVVRNPPIPCYSSFNVFISKYER